MPFTKKLKQEEPLNYRPVSLTGIVCKMYEKIIEKQWTDYLERGVITDRQFGFRRGKSCVTNLLSFYSRMIDIIQERDGWVDYIYLNKKGI